MYDIEAVARTQLRVKNQVEHIIISLPEAESQALTDEQLIGRTEEALAAIGLDAGHQAVATVHRDTDQRARPLGGRQRQPSHAQGLESAAQLEPTALGTPGDGAQIRDGGRARAGGRALPWPPDTTHRLGHQGRTAGLGAAARPGQRAARRPGAFVRP
jgi:hypothetical protein